MKGFRVNLRTFLGLAMPNQCCQTIEKEIFLSQTSYYCTICLSLVMHSIVKKPPNVDKQVLGKAIIIIANYSLGKLSTNKKPHINNHFTGWMNMFSTGIQHVNSG